MKKPTVSVRCHPGYERLCRRLADQLGAPLLNAGDPDAAAFRLEPGAHGLALHGNAPPRCGPLRIDFNRARTPAGPDPLRKAIGARAKTVVDATAGWAADALHLARCGYAVTAVERHPVVAAMLLHAHTRCRDPAVLARLVIIHGDSLDYLRAPESFDHHGPPDVVYLDPMYPPPAKSAAAKKPLTMLRRMAGPAGDCRPLFAQAMARATQRVVVKRPHRAPPLFPGKVGETAGKLVRFDIYAPRAE